MSKNGLILLTPTTVDKTGGGSETATISANGSVEFSACVTLSLNGVFTADYDNYMVVIRHLGSTIDNIAIRLRTSGVDASGANYTRQYLLANGSTVGGNRDTSQTNALLGAGMSATQRSGNILYLYGPFLAQPTATRDVGISGESGAYLVDRANTHSLSTSYDGISFIMNSPQTLSGRVAVYGMRK